MPHDQKSIFRGKKKIVSKSLKFLLILLVWVFVSLNTIIKSQDQFFFQKNEKQTTIYTLKFKLIKIKFNVEGHFFLLRLKTSSFLQQLHKQMYYSIKGLRTSDFKRIPFPGL